jgi:hypothetical protein
MQDFKTTVSAFCYSLIHQQKRLQEPVPKEDAERQRMEAKRLLEDLVRDEDSKVEDSKVEDNKGEDRSKGRRPSRYVKVHVLQIKKIAAMAEKETLQYMGRVMSLKGPQSR